MYEMENSEEMSVDERDPGGMLGISDQRFKNWFKPFSSSGHHGLPHPLVMDEG